jgi:hypothetical protein
VIYPAAAGNDALTSVSTASESLDPDNQTLMTVYRLGEVDDVDAPETVVSEVADPATGFKTVTAISPEGCQAIRQLDDRGRVISVRLGDLEPTVFNYVAAGAARL